MNYADHSREQIEQALDVAVSSLEMAINYSNAEKDRLNAKSALYTINVILETQRPEQQQTLPPGPTLTLHNQD